MEHRSPARWRIVTVVVMLAASGVLTLRPAHAQVAESQYRGFFRIDRVGGAGTAMLTITGLTEAIDVGRLAAQPVTARLTLGTRTLPRLAGVLVGTEFDLAGTDGLQQVAIRGTIHDAGPNARWSVVEARYLIQFLIRQETGSLALVKRQDATGLPIVGGDWDYEGATQGSAPKPLSARLSQSPSGALSGSVGMGGRTLSAVGQMYQGEAFALAVGDAAESAVLFGVVSGLSGRPIVPLLTGLLSRMGAGNATSLALAARGVTEPFTMSAKLRAPSFTVDTSLIPHQTSLPTRSDGLPRSTARIVDREGLGIDFAADELIVRTSDASQLAAFLARWKGIVVHSFTPSQVVGGATVYVVRVDPAGADTSSLGSWLQQLDPRSRGSHRVSSQRGLELIAAATKERLAGLRIGLNWVGQGYGHARDRLFDSRVEESFVCADCGKDYDRNPFTWPWLIRSGGASYDDYQVPRAWRMLEVAHKLDNHVLIWIIDGGFADDDDMPSGSMPSTPLANPGKCGGGSSCPWHGLHVAQIAGGIVDNLAGTAGTGGPVADIGFCQQSDWASAEECVDAGINEGAEVINMSFGGAVPAALSWTLDDFEDTTEHAEGAGITLLAAAGNDGRDVDAEDCFVACWEENWWAPCENNGVICVGGMNTAGARIADSNYGYESCGTYICNVEIFAPFTVYVGGDPDSTPPDISVSSGTSFSSPYVAGVVALMRAANPNLNGSQIKGTLLGSADLVGALGVSRRVQAAEAVWRSFSGNQQPYVAVTSPPFSGVSVDYGAFNNVLLEAYAADIASSQSIILEPCCDVRWYSDVDGSIGPGRIRSYVFPTPGDRQITVTNTDPQGLTDVKTIKIHVVNSRPQIEVQRPVQGGQYYRGLSYRFLASVTDPNEIQAPCSYLTWTSSNPNDSVFPATGCQPTVSFSTAGSRKITVVARDVYGLTRTVERSVTVIDQNPNSPPIVSIVSPSEGTRVTSDVVVALDGSSSEPDGDAVTYRWIASWGGAQKVLGTTLDTNWRPWQDIGGQCNLVLVTLVLEATDKDGTGSDTAHIWVGNGPC